MSIREGKASAPDQLGRGAADTVNPVPRRFSWALAGTVSQASAQVFILTSLARLGNQDLLAEYAFVLALLSPIFLFSSFQLRQLLIPDPNGAARFVEYFSVRLISIAVVSVCLVAGASIFSQDQDFILLVAAVSAARSMELVAELAQAYFQSIGHFHIAARSQIFRSSLGVVGFVAIFAFSRSLILAALGQALMITGTFFLHDCRLIGLWAMFSRKWDSIDGSSFRKRLLRIIITGVPLGAAIAMSSMPSNIPRILLGIVSGPEALSMFAVALSFAQIGVLVDVAVGQAILPSLTGFAASGHRASFLKLYFRSLFSVALLGSFGVLLSFWIGQWALGTIFGEEYRAAANTLSLILIGATFGFCTGVTLSALNARMNYKPQIEIAGTQTLVAAIFCLFLIPPLGATGAAVAFILARAGGLLVAGRALQKSLAGANT